MAEVGLLTVVAISAPLDPAANHPRRVDAVIVLFHDGAEPAQPQFGVKHG